MANVLNSSTQSLVRGIPQPILGPVGNLILAPEGGFGSAPAGATDNLLSYWDLTEASGNRADSAGANTFVDGNTVTSIAGLLSPTLAADYNSSNAEHFSVASGHNMAFDTHNIISAVGWFNFDKNFIPHYFLHVGSDYQTATAYAWQIRRNTNQTIEARCGGATGGATTVIGSTLAQDVWGFVFAYYNWDTLEMGLSINDGVVGTASMAGKTPMITAKTFYQGFAQPSYDFDGQAQSIGIYNAQLTPATVTTLYNGGVPLLHAEL